MRVLVVGGGLGGMTLARALLHAHEPRIEVLVAERDSGPGERAQGYHIGLQPHGIAALRAACGADDAGLRSAIEFSTNGFAVCTAHARELALLSLGDGEGGIVNRVALRDALSAPLCGAGVVLWNKRLVRYDEDDGGVHAHFDDGTVLHADVLVGADGVHSRVRVQRAPSLQLEKVGVYSLFGVLDASREIDAATPTLGRMLARSMVRLLGWSAPAATVLLFRYVDRDTGAPRMWWVFTVDASFVDAALAVPQAGDGGTRASQAGLRALVERLAHAFHPEVRVLVDATARIEGERELECVRAPSRFSRQFSVLRGGDSCVTLLGDAMHASTTHRGLGANTAFVDAVDLANALVGAVRGASGRPDRRAIGRALDSYASVAFPRGMGVVTESLQSTRMIMWTGAMAYVRAAIFGAVGAVMRLRAWWRRARA